MVRIDQILIPIESGALRDAAGTMSAIRRKAARLLGLRPHDLKRIFIVRHSIDARKKPQLFDVYSVDVELDGDAQRMALRHAGTRARQTPEAAVWRLPPRGSLLLHGRPVVVGAGPAGLFCALVLSMAGLSPLVIERGDDTACRDRKVRRFWEEGVLDGESNVQFGLGGAGAYSDGKLNTGVGDRGGALRFVLESLVSMGAPADILTESHPHIGTDLLGGVVGNMVSSIRAMGGEVLFNDRLDGVVFDGVGRVVCARTTRGDVPAKAIVLAIGHSSRDTVKTLLSDGVAMEQKSFAVGLRIAHPQRTVDLAQYGWEDRGELPPAIYKLTARAADGRGVYSFCMCPGGWIVNASSEEGCLCTNGMSGRARDGGFSNSAIVVTVDPVDYNEGGSPIDGVAFQRRMEKRAFEAGEGRIPVSSFSNFKSEVESSGRLKLVGGIDYGAFRGMVRETSIKGILPGFVEEDIVRCVGEFGRRMPGFDGREAVVAGVESRTSSPVRMVRDEGFCAVGHGGLYPCGEGAGFAGGIVSAAIDGVRVAESIARRYGGLFEA